MLYVQYFDRTADGRLIEACGDRAVFILDGRQNADTHHADAKRNNGRRRPKYDGYRLMRGDTFTRAAPASPVFYLGE